MAVTSQQKHHHHHVPAWAKIFFFALVGSVLIFLFPYFSSSSSLHKYIVLSSEQHLSDAPIQTNSTLSTTTSTRTKKTNVTFQQYYRTSSVKNDSNILDSNNKEDTIGTTEELQAPETRVDSSNGTTTDKKDGVILELPETGQKTDAATATKTETESETTKNEEAAAVTEKKDVVTAADDEGQKENKTSAAANDEQNNLLNDDKATDVPFKKNHPHKPLNIIVLYPDDMRHDSLGIAGTQPVLTPNLDQFAREGIRFTHNCVTTSICWISRATLFSGQYNLRHQATYLFRPISDEAWQFTYPALLRKHGYHLGHIGKWQYRNADLASKNFFDLAFMYEGQHVFRKKGKDIHVTDRNREDAIHFLQTRPKDKNFALQVAFYAPKAVGRSDMQWTPMEKTAHLYQNLTLERPQGWNESLHRLPHFYRLNDGKFEARRRWHERFGTDRKYDASMKAYYRMITEVDEACGDIYKELEKQGILNETMIIFTTDNGFFHSEHGLAGKWFPYQESIRVPLIIRDPRIPPTKTGTTIDEFTLNIDLASTILGAAGLETHSRMQGRDISDLYLEQQSNNLQQTPWRKEFFYEFPSKGANTIPSATALVRKDFKLFHYPEWNVSQLFNLKDDPMEEYDVIDDPKYADLVKEMWQRHNELQKLAE